MTRTMLKSKIHRATVTDADVDNGARLETYTIAGARGSGEVKVDGAAARLVHHGDTVVVTAHAQYPPAELEQYEPLAVPVDRENRITGVDGAVGTLLTSMEA